MNDNQLTTLPAGVFDGLTNLETLDLRRNHLVGLTWRDPLFANLPRRWAIELDGQTRPSWQRDICGRTPQVRDAILQALEANGAQNAIERDECVAVDARRMAGIARLNFWNHGLRTLRAGDLADLTGLQELDLNQNRLTALPAGVFDGLTSLVSLDLSHNRLTALPAGVFNGMTSLGSLDLSRNQLTALPAGVFDGLNSLGLLDLGHNRLTALPAGVFDSLHSLQDLFLHGNRLAALPAGVFDGLTGLQSLLLFGNQLAALPAGVFDSLTGLQELHLNDNRLTALPAGVFDGLASLRELDLRGNPLGGLTRNDPLFAALPGGVSILLGGQTEPRLSRLAAAVPLMLTASDSTRQGFVRIVNESRESGSVRVSAFDDGGYAPDPIEIRLGAGQTVHFNSNDLENGNADKGVARGVGGPVQGDWRLDVETALSVRVLAFVRTDDGFLTAMHDVLPRDDRRRLVAHTFNPGSNRNQESKLRLVNTGENAERVSIEGVDDQGGNAGPVTLTLGPREARTLSAFDLENGAEGLAGRLGGGAGKWRLFVTAGDSVVGVSLLDSVSGHLTNISTAGVAER